MNKHNLKYILHLLAHMFEGTAEKTHIEEFKVKYKGMKWDQGIERSLLNYADNTLTIERWIENLTNFMMEKDISFDLRSKS